MVGKKILEIFIELGKNDHLDSPEYIGQIKDLKEYDFINIIGPDECSKIIKDFSVDDLYFLIRAIVIAERENKWSGGSVASSIWLFIEFQKLDYLRSIELANWILPRTDNYYVPFGFNNHNAKTYSGYFDLVKRRSKKINEYLNHQKELEKQARIEREKRVIQKRKSNDKRRSAERDKFIENLSPIPLVEQLNMLANDDYHSVGFYPSILADRCSKEFIISLPTEIQVLLLKKLKGHHRGPWGKFKKRLIRVYNNNTRKKKLPWDLKPWDL